MAFGVYVHWPFCAAKCPYCDFNSHVAGAVDQDRWLRAFEGEIARYASLTRDEIVSSIYFGGGTPSLMSARTVDGILNVITKSWRLSNDPEVTLEANPTSFEAERFADYRQAGVNRLSVGVQALNDRDLKALGRLHTADEARAAFRVGREIFPRVSLDLIYARQHQTLEGWSRELDEALGLAADHLSLYQLTIEDGTAFSARHAAGGMRGLPDEDLSVSLYELTNARCAEAGFEAYEVSNYARPGAESRHNLVYWSGAPYVGVGPGAHGRITQGNRWFATEAFREPGRWLSAAEQGNGESVFEEIGPRDRAEEQLLMGLRLKAGVSRQWVAARFDPGVLARLADLERDGLIEADETTVRTTDAGRMVLNAVIAALLT